MLGRDQDTGELERPGDIAEPAPGETADAAEDTAGPVMPAPPPFPAFHNRPSLPHQVPGGGFESGRDSRAR